MEKSTAVNFKEQWMILILPNNKKNKMPWKLDTTSRVFLGIFVDRNHFQYRAKLHVPKESSFPIPLKCTDVVMRTICHIGCFARKSNQ